MKVRGEDVMLLNIDDDDDDDAAPVHRTTDMTTMNVTKIFILVCLLILVFLLAVAGLTIP